MYLSSRAQELKLSNHHFPTSKAPATVAICQCRHSVTLRLQRMNLCHQSMNDRTPRRKKNAKKNKKKENQTPQHPAHFTTRPFPCPPSISYPSSDPFPPHDRSARARGPGLSSRHAVRKLGIIQPHNAREMPGVKEKRHQTRSILSSFRLREAMQPPFGFLFCTFYVGSPRACCNLALCSPEDAA